MKEIQFKHSYSYYMFYEMGEVIYEVVIYVG